jgi:hypothetical protein
MQMTRGEMYQLAAQIFADTMARRNAGAAETLPPQVARDVARDSIEFAKTFARAAAADEATSV